MCSVRLAELISLNLVIKKDGEVFHEGKGRRPNDHCHPTKTSSEHLVRHHAPPPTGNIEHLAHVYPVVFTALLISANLSYRYS